MDPLYWSLLLLGVGIALIVLELFVPSGGVLGLLAVVSLLAAVWVGYTGGPLLGTSVLVLTLIVVPIVVGVGLKLWPHTPFGRLILGRGPENPNDVLPKTETYQGLEQLVGRHGMAKTKMLPSGHVVIEGKTYDALTAGMAIEAGEPVRVVDVRTQRLVVRPVAEALLDHEEYASDPLSQPIDSLGLDDPLA